MAPIVKSEVSVLMITGFARLKWVSMGAAVNRFYSSSKVASTSGFLDHFSVFLVNSVSS